MWPGRSPQLQGAHPHHTQPSNPTPVTHHITTHHTHTHGHHRFEYDNLRVSYLLELPPGWEAGEGALAGSTQHCYTGEPPPTPHPLHFLLLLLLLLPLLLNHIETKSNKTEPIMTTKTCDCDTRHPSQINLRLCVYLSHIKMSSEKMAWNRIYWDLLIYCIMGKEQKKRANSRKRE